LTFSYECSFGDTYCLQQLLSHAFPLNLGRIFFFPRVAGENQFDLHPFTSSFLPGFHAPGYPGTFLRDGSPLFPLCFSFAKTIPPDHWRSTTWILCRFVAVPQRTAWFFLMSPSPPYEGSPFNSIIPRLRFHPNTLSVQLRMKRFVVQFKAPTLLFYPPS